MIRNPDKTRGSDSDPQAGERIEPVADWLQEVEFRRPAPSSARPDRAHWRWVLATMLVLGVAVVVFRQPLAVLVWPDMRVQRLLEDAETALKQGRLSDVDGTGARQRFEAALALDSDRSDARAGLGRLAEMALVQARAHVQAERFEAARQALALARELQVPRADADKVAEQLRVAESAHAGIDTLMAAAAAAQAEGNLEVALPLYQRVLALQPTQTLALEGREDALSEWLQQAKQALAGGDMARGSSVIAQARSYDPGHVDLPDLEARLARSVEQERRRADADLRRQRLDQALTGYRLV
ncbi:MAG: hypothetical protein ABIP44_03780, partial [Pseudoxanthomonas sp.]